MAIHPSDIYTGIWTDWAEGNNWMLISKITISSRVAGVLTSVLTLYISLAASQLWYLTAYTIHCIRQGVTRSECAPILQQQQVILKACLPAPSAATRFTYLFWANRSAPSSLLSSLPLILLATLYAVGSIVAGLYSSQIVNSSSLVVLLNSSNCGYVNPDTSAASGDIEVAVDRYYLNTLTMATALSRQCYNATDTELCGPFVQPTLNWTTNWKARCPFHESMCDGPAIELDTGLINSNTALGLNSPLEDQVNLRKITTCAPITQDGYTTTAKVNASNTYARSFVPGDEMVLNAYGRSVANLGGNFTWGVSKYAANSTLMRTMWLQVYFGGPNANMSSFRPIPEMEAPGDATLFFISNNALLFVEPCDDPVFSAHMAYWHPLTDSTYYLQDRVTGVLGCLEQYQWCDAHKGACSTVGNVGDLMTQLPRNIVPTAMQNATITMIAQALKDHASLPHTAALPNLNLAADRNANIPFQLPLPSNQWQVEVQNWHATVMVLLQQALLQRMAGPTDPVLSRYVDRPSTPEDIALCGRQRVRLCPGGGVANVSTVGLFLILTSSTLVILTSLFLDKIAGYVGGWLPSVRARQRTWVLDDCLHLQRLVYEARAKVQGDEERGPEYVWVGIDGDTPRVVGDALLGPLVGPDVKDVALKPLISP
ncbi:hypothetical protein GGS23DRAFT_576140 [Durotheca rogersii]|uniref:uncharacterized protein n=1 Tax=Durotheca rogersii TaxID=419775 RepID=UPI00221E4E56|nr:uncharacterized protein GGS23DRAFT_576140 [Durotheca rogersii]KAI5861300.1 hypothetical protein GGS23DRAFT_576140 [Durotheca rogersii]